MAARRSRTKSDPPPALRPWTVALAAMAALARGDGGTGLDHLASNAGLTKAPSVTFVIKKARRARPPAHELPKRYRDVPYADDEPTLLLPVDALPLRAMG
jgi:hypothetical protein